MVLELRLQRLPHKTIAYKTGVSRKTVWSILKRMAQSG